MNQIDQDFVYNRYPKNEHDVQMLDSYKKVLKVSELQSDSLLNHIVLIKKMLYDLPISDSWH